MDDGRVEGFKTRQKVEDMMRYAYAALEQYPKSEKFALVTDIKHVMDEMLRYCVEIEKKKSRKTTLDKLDINIGVIQAYIRLSYDLKFLPPKKYEVWSEMAVENRQDGWRPPESRTGAVKSWGVDRCGPSTAAGTGRTAAMPESSTRTGTTPGPMGRTRTSGSAPLYPTARCRRLTGLRPAQG